MGSGAFFSCKSPSESLESATSQPYGYERRDDPGLAGVVARWWLRRRTDRVAAALDEAKQAAEAHGAEKRAAADRRARRGWGGDRRRSGTPVAPRQRSDAPAEPGRRAPRQP
ncbi:hypothetical protein GCM10027596_21700 [Nocardioides korecus]